MDAPYGFTHQLDPDLFALDRLHGLFGRAPAGKAVVQLADEGRERRPGEGPHVTSLTGQLADEVHKRSLHVHFEDLPAWAPEYGAARDHVLEAAGIDPSAPRYAENVVIRVFSPDVPVALHGDAETQLDCGLAGRNAWHFYPPSGLSQEEQENLLHGGHFVSWREMELFKTFDLHPGDGLASPPRWPHWIEHPGPDPAVSFEVGFFTAADIRERKVWDVNWMLRKARIRPIPPGEVRARDARKQRVFDAISLVTGRGREFRGV
jgi:hypothetical protein